MKKILFLLVIILIMPIVFAEEEICIDKDEELFILNNIVVTFCLDRGNSIIEKGDNLVMDFRKADKNQCFASEDEISVGQNTILDIQVENGVKDQLLIGDGTIMTLVMEVSETEPPELERMLTDGDACYAFNLIGDSLTIKGSLYINLPLCMSEQGDPLHISICEIAPCSEILSIGDYIDIGLRYRHNGVTYSIGSNDEELV